jgi:hypothetical protein
LIRLLAHAVEGSLHVVRGDGLRSVRLRAMANLRVMCCTP